MNEQDSVSSIQARNHSQVECVITISIDFLMLRTNVNPCRATGHYLWKCLDDAIIPNTTLDPFTSGAYTWSATYQSIWIEINVFWEIYRREIYDWKLALMEEKNLSLNIFNYFSFKSYVQMFQTMLTLFMSKAKQV